MSEQWIKTPFANLYRYGEKGSYHVRAHVNGRLVRASLKTKSQEIAILKMADVLASARAQPSAKKSSEDLTALVTTIKERLQTVPGIKASTRKYKIECIEAIQRTDKDLFALTSRNLTPERLSRTADDLRKKYSPTRYNGMVTVLLEIFREAKAAGLVACNPAAELPRASVPLTEPSLPEPKQWEAVLAKLDSHPSRKRGALFVRLLSLMGARISAVRKLRVEDCDFARNEVLIPPVKYDDKPTRLPMYPALRKLLKAACSDRKTGRLVDIDSPRKALRNSCRDAGITRLTPHTLRHLFATRCIEAGVDIRTVAAWLGHKDGGALLLRRYAHLRRDHSQKMAKLLKF